MKMKSEKQRLVLLDSHAILHRAYHAIPDFATSKGEPTGALYGLITMLLKAVSDFNPDYIIAARDLPGPTFRDKLFEAYKGTRAEIDEMLIGQLKKAPNVLEAFGIPVYSCEGFEADDVIGTIVEKVKKKNVDVIIATGDADMFQLVDDARVQVYHLRQGINDLVLYDDARVHERYGFGPEQVIDYKGIRGDASDNIPGVPGVGEGSATKLIETFGSLEHIYAAIEKKGVEDIAKKAGVQKRYVQLVVDNKEKAFFSRELATIRRDAPINFELPKQEWRLSDYVPAISAVCDELEFRSLKERVLKITGSADEKKEGGVEKETAAPSADIDTQVLAEVAVALWLIRSDTTNPTLEEILQFANTDDFEKAKEFIFKTLRETGRLREVYETIERPLVPVIKRMNDDGVALDVKYLKKLSKEYSKELAYLASRIHQHAGHEFNINSPKQLADVLFDELKISTPKQKKTATGARTTREEELQKMSSQHPIIADVLAHRELQKLLSTYIDKMVELVDKGGRLHAEFLQAGSSTGRMASQNPGLQNIPIRTEYGKRIREGFIAPAGFVLASIDYSQIELRIAAGLSGDEKLIDVFKKGGDIHTAVASQVFAVQPEMVDREMRRRAKVINFGILYGMGVNALRQALGGNVSRDEASQYISDYFANFPGLARYIEETKASAERLGYTETIFGRRRYFPGFKSQLPGIRAQAERMAVNAPMQGTQSDIIKLAMVEADAMIEKEGWRESVKLVLQVHDELVYEIAEKDADTVARRIKHVMEVVAPIDKLGGVPIITDMALGKNWGALKKVT